MPSTSASSALPSTPSPSLPSPEELRPPDRRHHGVKLNVKIPKMPEASSLSTATSPPLYSASSALPSTPSPSLPSPEELRPPDRRHHGVKLNVKMPKMSYILCLRHLLQQDPRSIRLQSAEHLEDALASFLFAPSPVSSVLAGQLSCTSTSSITCTPSLYE